MLQSSAPVATAVAQKTPFVVKKGMSNAPQKAVTPVSHEDLLLAVGQKRDRAAFVELFRFYAPRIKSYLLKHGADETTAEDIAQITMVTVWEKAKKYNPAKARASTWIFTIARNRRIDMLRREKFAVSDPEEKLIQTPAPENEDNYVDKKTGVQLEKAIHDLPDEQARLLHMAFFEDKSHQKIADETKLPLGTVKSRIRLAMDKLRQALKRGNVQ